MVELTEDQKQIACEAYKERVGAPSTLTAEGLYTACAAVLAASPQTQPD